MHVCSCINVVIICLMWKKANSVAKFFCFVLGFFVWVFGVFCFLFFCCSWRVFFFADFCEWNGFLWQNVSKHSCFVFSYTLPGQRLKSNDQEIILFCWLMTTIDWVLLVGGPTFSCNPFERISSISEFYTVDRPRGTQGSVWASENGPWQSMAT